MRLRAVVFGILVSLLATSGFSWCVYCENFTCWMTSVNAGNVYCTSSSGGCIAWGGCDAGTSGCPEGPTGCKRVPTYVPSRLTPLKPATACTAQLADAWTLESVQFTPAAQNADRAAKQTAQPSKSVVELTSSR